MKHASHKATTVSRQKFSLAKALFASGKGSHSVRAVRAVQSAGSDAVVLGLDPAIAEKINENGIGNGISIILFANIVSRLPSMIHNLWSAYLTSGNAGKIILGIGVIIVSLAATALIVFITDSERRLPIQ